MKNTWFLPLLLIGTAANAEGFSASDLAQAAQNADTTRQALASATEQLRRQIALDPAQGIFARDFAEQVALLATLPNGDEKRDLRLKWFMAGAIAQPSHGTTTILYNPLARGTLALDWRKGPKGWRVAFAWLSSSGPADWPMRSEPWRKAFTEDYATARAFEGDMGRDWVAFESDRWLGGLAEALADPAKRAAIEGAGKLIVAGRTARAGGENIDLLPERARKTYAPIAAIARADGGLAVIYGSALLPQMLIAGDIDPRGSLEKLSLINLGNVGEAQ